ncbi:response regulator transcription factor [Clostridium hydrogenum]|uniref:response regulator transcription factor n=1 Tax=Clostridium hydrogenum TaxID=2855764 RepID=UPI001F349078|nr:response regulator [Clostridium hydrogenum]
MKIAIIEDEYVIRKGISRTLEKINSKYEIVGQAEDGLEGLNLIKEKSPDLIITDIKMPKMDGLELLNELRNSGIQVKAIVLSAYSEFEYAQKAISLGVSEYILKPISILDLSSALERIENQINEEKKVKAEHPKELYELNSILLRSIKGNLNISDSLSAFLKEQYNLAIEEEMGVFEIYLGELFQSKINDLKAQLKLINKRQFDYNILEFSQDNIVILVIYNMESKDKVKVYFEKSVIFIIRSIISKEFVYGLAFCNGLLKLSESVEGLKSKLGFNLVMKEGTLINYEVVNNMDTKQFLYPINIENKIKVAIVKRDVAKVKEVFQSFESYCKSEIYEPKDIKEACVNFCWTVINTAKELNSLPYQNLDVQTILKKVMTAITWKEVEQALYILFNAISESNVKEDNKTVSLVVKRAESLIHEYYNQGINLDEIAAKLNITADYLGKQFKKETGESFNAYTKNYRINKVKTLLLGTELKVYQIAELTGYSDSKYMSKVFKETTGYLPNDYRKLYR